MDYLINFVRSEFNYLGGNYFRAEGMKFLAKVHWKNLIMLYISKLNEIAVYGRLTDEEMLSLLMQST